MTARNLYDLLRHPIENSPQNIAIVAPDGQEITYLRIAQSIARFARKARDHGIAPGQLVAINLTHPAAIICMIVAMSRIGAVAAIGDRARAMTEAGVKLNAIISDSMDYSSDPGAVRFDQSWAAENDEATELADEATWLPSELAFICASSGSTGERKFFTLNFETQIARIAVHDSVRDTQNSRRLITPGMSSSWGVQNGLTTLQSGGLLLLPAGNAVQTMAQVERLAISEIMTTPNLLIDLANARNDAQSLAALKRVVVGGSQVSPALIEKARQKLCPDIVIAYGATETGPTAHGTLDVIGRRPGAVGKIAPWAEMRVLSLQDEVLPEGKAGRLQIRVPARYRLAASIARGEATSPYDGEGWFEPGDLGSLEGGILILDGRSSEVINVGGNKLSPHRLEEFISKIPGVINSAVVSQTNEAGFDTVCIGLIAGPKFVLSHFDEQLSRRIGKITPRKFLVLDELPLLASGKVDKPNLKSLFATVGEYGPRALTD